MPPIYGQPWQPARYLPPCAPFAADSQGDSAVCLSFAAKRPSSPELPTHLFGAGHIGAMSACATGWSCSSDGDHVTARPGRLPRFGGARRDYFCARQKGRPRFDHRGRYRGSTTVTQRTPGRTSTWAPTPPPSPPCLGRVWCEARPRRSSPGKNRGTLDPTGLRAGDARRDLRLGLRSSPSYPDGMPSYRVTPEQLVAVFRPLQAAVRRGQAAEAAYDGIELQRRARLTMFFLGCGFLGTAAWHRRTDDTAGDLCEGPHRRGASRPPGRHPLRRSCRTAPAHHIAHLRYETRRPGGRPMFSKTAQGGTATGGRGSRPPFHVSGGVNRPGWFTGMGQLPPDDGDANSNVGLRPAVKQVVDVCRSSRRPQSTS